MDKHPLAKWAPAFRGMYDIGLSVQNPSAVPDRHKNETLAELHALWREHEAALRTTSDPEEQWRLRHILQQISYCILVAADDAKSA